MRLPRLHRLSIGLALACAWACERPALPQLERAESRAPAPNDRGDVCADLGNLRACWTNGAAVVAPRPVPDGPAPPEGWRCGGAQSARTCEARARHAGPFACDAQRCVQTWPRRPDDGEWDCVDIAGIVYCLSRVPAAGIASGPIGRGWLCGERSGSNSGERVCVDLDPDVPDPKGAFQCEFEYPHGRAARVCRPTNRPRAGAACSANTECSEGMRCSSGRCLPPAPYPTCWFDKDCGTGACRWGTCAEAGA